MTLEVRGEIPREVREEIEAATDSQRTLEDVVRWSLGLRPPLLIQEIVTQDEYTHENEGLPLSPPRLSVNSLSPFPHVPIGQPARSRAPSSAVPR